MYCLSQIGYDEEEGIYDLSRITEKVPMSHRGKIDTFINVLRDLTERVGKEIYYKELLFECEKLSIPKWEISSLIDELKRMTRVIEPRAGVFTLLE
jgi:DNA replicative helicase MCM subunit Mcm2 (Cdc46/Mcm family)